MEQPEERMVQICQICRDELIYPCTFACRTHVACITCAKTIVDGCFRINSQNGSPHLKSVRCPFCKESETTGLGIYPLTAFAYDLHAINIKSMLPDVLGCFYCDEKSSSIGELCNHMCKCSSRTFKCPLCPALITYEQIFEKTHWNLDCTGVRCRYCPHTGVLSAIRTHEAHHESMFRLGTVMQDIGDVIRNAIPLSDDTEFVQSLDHLCSSLPVLSQHSVSDVLISFSKLLDLWTRTRGENDNISSTTVSDIVV